MSNLHWHQYSSCRDDHGPSKDDLLAEVARLRAELEQCGNMSRQRFVEYAKLHDENERLRALLDEVNDWFGENSAVPRPPGLLIYKALAALEEEA